MEQLLQNHELIFDNEGYCLSFKTTDFDNNQQLDDVKVNPIAFFKKFGFLVVRDVLTKDDCDKTCSEIFNIIESKSPKFKRNDTSTWDEFPKEDAIPQYGSPSKPPVFTKQFIHNRTNPNVYKVFSSILQNQDLLTNFDRCCFFRPTKGVLQKDGTVVDKPEWGTKNNLHLDMNPHAWLGNGDECRSVLDSLRYAHKSEFIVENNQPSAADGIQLQAVLNLLDNREEDGGYVVVPGFNHIFVDYFTNVKKATPGKVIDTKANPSYNFNSKELPYRYAKRISMRQGSMVIWDQRMPHGSFSNQSNRPRMAQFLKIFPANTVSKDRFLARSKVVKHNITYNIEGGPFPLNDLSTQLLGLKDLK
ncbi:WD repeat protein [Tieghemostelium lacteum]|uniref:WD repeat protein n=1 Tax=Tieghemostelium lacteum TaxID=361077 RepID=A0A151Z3C7_TIELA|nr:WD repeat protein [Tieghemostelium lacteum]|eukprot:KYQ88466.1 WD repeat protein [Tieghemostelium lacteum]